MVPWLSKQELTSSLFREYVEEGMVTWGYELLGSAHRFLGNRSLNLGLVDEFQAFALSLLVEGHESFCMILE